ncbi:MAG: TIGR04255 family protein [Candidatus Eremiobacterota bacterium]
MTEGFSKYPRDPIVEAICELRLEGWEPDRLVDSLRAAYPRVSRQSQRRFTIRFDQPEIIGQVDEEGSVLRLASPDEKDLVRLGPGLVSVHRLSPYNHWEQFLPSVGAVFARLTDAGGRDIRRVGLRYINRFDLPLPAELTDYFAVHPTLPLMGGERLGPFQLRAELHDQEAPERILVVQMGHGEPGRPNTFPVVLDIHRLHVAPPQDWSEIASVLEEAHVRIRTTFESFITDRLRKEVLLLGKERPDAPAA